MTKPTITIFFPNFTWAIPRLFGDPLSTCRFEQGDTLYENGSAYHLPWSEACETAGLAIQVLSPSRGVTSKSPGQQQSAFAESWQSEIVFDLHDLSSGSSEAITTTQGRLYTLLWRGDLKILDEDKDSPLVPRQASDLKKLLSDAVKLFPTGKLPESDLVRFFMPCDLAEGLYRDKYLNVKTKLESEFETTTRLEPAGNLGGQPYFLPTVHVAGFSMAKTTAEQVEMVLQGILYRPSVSRKGVSRFRLKTHGLLI